MLVVSRDVEVAILDRAINHEHPVLKGEEERVCSEILIISAAHEFSCCSFCFSCCSLCCIRLQRVEENKCIGQWWPVLLNPCCSALLLNNNSLSKNLRVLLLSISHLGKQVNLNKKMISDTNLIQWHKPYLGL